MSVKTNSSFHGQGNQQLAQVKEESKSQRQNSVVHFANDIPLVVVEIPLNGKIAKLPIFEFSSPDNLAAQFCRKYQLDEKLKKPIRKMIEQQMQQALNAKQQQNSSTEIPPDTQNTRQLIKSQSTVQFVQQNQQYPPQLQQQQPQQQIDYRKKQQEQQNDKNGNAKQHIQDDQQNDQRPSRRNVAQAARNIQEEDQQIEGNFQEQTKLDKKNKGSYGGNEGQVKNNENQYQTLKKLKNKDFFTENSETENEQSDFVDIRKPIGKPVKNQVQNNGEQRTLQKNRQTQSSALLVRQSKKIGDDMIQEQDYQSQSQVQRLQNKPQQDYVPNIVLNNQQQTRSILKQNKSQENLLKNNELNNTQDQRINHKNQQPQNNQIRRSNEEYEQHNSENNNGNISQKQRVAQKSKEEFEGRNHSQKDNNIDFNDEIINDDTNIQENENEQERNQNISYQSEGQEQIIRNYQHQNKVYQNGTEHKNPNLKSKGNLQQTPQQKDQHDHLSAQFTFNEEEEDTIVEQDQNKYQQNVEDYQKKGQIQQIRNHPANQLKSNQTQHQQLNNSRGSQGSNQSNSTGLKKQQTKTQNSNFQNQVQPKKQINTTPEHFQQIGDNEEDDTEVDELNQMPQISQKNIKQIPLKNQANKQKIPNKSNQIKQTDYKEQNEQDDEQEEILENNENDDFNRVDEAQDLVQDPNLQQQLSKPILRAPNGALKSNMGQIVAQQGGKEVNMTQKQIPKKTSKSINQNKEEILNNENVFNQIHIDQNEVSDFTQGQPQLISQPQLQQFQQQYFNGNNNYIPPPQSFMSPPPPSHYQNYQSNQPNAYQSPVQYPQQQMNPYLGSPTNQIDYSLNNIQNSNRPLNYNPSYRQLNTIQPQDNYYNTYNQPPQQYQQPLLSPIQKNYQNQIYQDQQGFDVANQNQGMQQHYQPYSQNQYHTNPQMMNQHIANQTLNSSFLTNHPVNTSINSSLINKSFTPRRRIFEEQNNQFSRNQPILPQNQFDYRANTEQMQIGTQKSGTTTPLRFRNNEQQQRNNVIYPSRSISPNGLNNYPNRNNDYLQQSPINSQSLQFTPNQLNQRGVFNPQTPLSNQQQNYNTFQQLPSYGFNQQQTFGQYPNNQGQPYPTQNKFNTLKQNYNTNQVGYIQSNQPNYQTYNNPPIQAQNISINPQERMNLTPRGIGALPMEQQQLNPVRDNIQTPQKQNETPSPNFAPVPERGAALRNNQPNNNVNRTPSPTQIISTNNNFNIKNVKIPLFEKIKQQQQEQFKQMGLDSNSNKSSNTFNQSNQFAPTAPSSQSISAHPINNGNNKGGEKISSSIAQPMAKAASQNQQPYFIIDKLQSSEEKDDIYNSNEQTNTQGITAPQNESKQDVINGIMFSLNANFKEPTQLNNNILQLFSLLDTKKQGWISQSQLDYSKLPAHFQLKSELSKLLEEAFSQSKTVDFDLFYKIATSKYPQIVQHCNSILHQNGTQQGGNQQQLRPPSFGLPKDTVIFQ